MNHAETAAVDQLLAAAGRTVSYHRHAARGVKPLDYDADPQNAELYDSLRRAYLRPGPREHEDWELTLSVQATPAEAEDIERRARAVGVDINAAPDPDRPAHTRFTLAYDPASDPLWLNHAR